MSRKSNRSAYDRAQAHLAAINYDFRRFTLGDFAQWLARRRQRRIIFVPQRMPTTLFSAWLASDDCDYVFYDVDTDPIHQAHIQLHEMAHMLCAHPAISVSSLQTRVLDSRWGAAIPPNKSAELRLARTGEQEQEAELLAALIQKRVLDCARPCNSAATAPRKPSLAGLCQLLEVGTAV